MRVLITGDLHTKADILLKIIEKGKHYDKVVFLGDYVDDWDKPPESSFNLLRNLVDYKKKNMDKVVLLLGNHDLSEWFGGEFQCSGRNPNTAMLVQPLFNENQDLFQVAYAIKSDLLCSHAGVTNGWLNDQSLLGAIDTSNAKSLETYLNAIYKHREDSREARQRFVGLSTAGPVRGGWSSPSPVWADERELAANPKPLLNQIVGHTPVTTVIEHQFRNGNGSRNSLWFCDTHSTYSNGEHIGDDTLLAYDEANNEFSEVVLYE